MPAHFVSELRSSFERHGPRTALEYRGELRTYAEVAAAARRCAAWLQTLGVSGGQRVVLLTPNKLPFLIGHLGVLFAGGVPLPLNPRFTREELNYFLEDSDPRVVIAGPDQRELLATCTQDRNCTIVLDAAVLDPPAHDFHEPSLAPGDPCLILYSSGTTGFPKGVVHTSANVASSLNALAACWRMTPDDVVVNTLPLYHIHGLAFATHLTWLSGGKLLVEDAFEPLRTMRAIGRGTVFMAVPTMYYKLLAEPTFPDIAKTWSSLRLVTCGSAPIRPEILPRLETILRRPVINRYGMSEAFVITSLPLGGPWPAGSVGLPLAGVEMRLLREDGLPAGPDEVGAVQIRGPNLFDRYWNKPEATAAALKDQWFDTGDLGRRDGSGFLTLVGRKHDLIIVSGYNVYPQVVERVIGECPGVAECAVFGLPDEQRGESVAAAVVRQEPGPDEAALLAWCRERLVYYQQPRRVLFVDSLPRNSMGKIVRRQLVELF